MGCCCKGLPQITLRNIFRRIRCISACCGGKIVIQASDIDGGEISISQLYYNPESPASFGGVDAKYQISTNKIRQWLAKQDTYTLHKPV